MNKAILLLISLLAVCTTALAAGDVTVNGKLEVSDGTNRLISYIGPSTYWGTYNAADFGLMTSNAARLYIKSGGNIGIGTTAPESKLHIVGNGAYGVIYRTSNNSTNNFWLHEDGSGFFRSGVWLTSDLSVKRNVQYFQSGLDAIARLKPVTFDYIDGPANQMGFIAQDVRMVLPAAVGVVDEKTGTLGMKMDQIIPLLVNAVKEQQQQILQQQMMILELKQLLSAK